VVQRWALANCLLVMTSFNAARMASSAHGNALSATLGGRGINESAGWVMMLSSGLPYLKR